MVQIGRMGVCSQGPQALAAARYMPDTFEQFVDVSAQQKLSLTAQIALNGLHEETARAYYAAQYEERDLKRDLRAIKAVMTSVPVAGK